MPAKHQYNNQLDLRNGKLEDDYRKYETNYEEGGQLWLIGRRGYGTEEGGDSMHED